MSAYSSYITGGGKRPKKSELKGILAKYPWFTSARIEYSHLSKKRDTLLDLYLLSHPALAAIPLPVAISEKESSNAIEVQANETSTECLESHVDPQAETILTDEDAIEKFLMGGGYRIIPDDNTPEYDAAEESAVFELSEDMASEELAQIYRSQGLIEQARQIYEQLSLLYPEKSVYFAEIISEMDADNAQK